MAGELQAPAPAEFKATPPAPTTPPTAVAVAERPNTSLTPDVASEVVAARPPRERAAHAITGAQNVIKVKYDGGFFDTDDKLGLKEPAEWAILYEGGEVTPEVSGSLKGMVDSLDAIGGEVAQGIRARLTESMRVKVGEGEDARFLTHEEWKAKLEQADAGERPLLEAQGLYGFVFSQEDEFQARRRAENLRTPEGRVILRHISQIEEEITQLRGNAHRSVEENSNLAKAEELLEILRQGERANGEIGIILKARALLEIGRAGRADEELMDARLNMGAKIKQAEGKLSDYLRGSGMPEADIARIFHGGDAMSALENLFKSETFKVDKDFVKLVFGKDALATDAELTSLLGNSLTPDQIAWLEKYGKDIKSGLLLLLIILWEGVSKTFGDLTTGR